MQRTFKRAGISVWYTEGFNPRVYIMFPLPLSLGYESGCEIMDFNITDDNLSNEEIMSKMNAVLPEGIQITEVYEPVMKHTAIEFSEYEIYLISEQHLYTAEKFRDFMSGEQIIIKKKTKQKTMKDVDIKPFSDILEINDTEKGLFIKLRMPSGSNASYNPSLLLSAFYEIIGEEPDFAEINRTRILTSGHEDFK